MLEKISGSRGGDKISGSFARAVSVLSREIRYSAYRNWAAALDTDLNDERFSRRPTIRRSQVCGAQGALKIAERLDRTWRVQSARLQIGTCESARYSVAIGKGLV
jgi:hypothetical protein